MVLGHDLQAPLGLRQRECACEQTFFFVSGTCKKIVDDYEFRMLVQGRKEHIFFLFSKNESNKSCDGTMGRFPFPDQWTVRLPLKKKKKRYTFYVTSLFVFVYCCSELGLIFVYFFLCLLSNHSHCDFLHTLKKMTILTFALISFYFLFLSERQC